MATQATDHLSWVNCSDHLFQREGERALDE